MNVTKEGLALHMARAFEGYANQVQNGNTKTWIPFTEGAETVNVKVTLVSDGIVIEPLDTPIKAEIPSIPQYQVSSPPVEPISEGKPIQRRRRTE